MKAKSIILLVFPTLFLSCTFFRLLRTNKIKNPTFSYIKCELKEINDNRAKIEIFLSSYNPNDIGLKNISVNYELFNDDKRFLKGDGIKIALNPKDTTRIVIPAEIIYRDVFNVIGPVAEKIILGRKLIPVRIDAVIFGNPTLYNEKEEGSLFSFSLKVSRTENIPIPEDDMEKVKKAAKNILKKIF